MPMNNMPQPPQRFVSEQQPSTTITLVPSSNTVGDDESVNDDQTSLSSSTDSQQKQTAMIQPENQSIGKISFIRKFRSNIFFSLHFRFNITINTEFIISIVVIFNGYSTINYY